MKSSHFVKGKMPAPAIVGARRRTWYRRSRSCQWPAMWLKK